MVEQAKLLVVGAVLVVVFIIVFTFFGGIFSSPEEQCARSGLLYDPVKQICISASGAGESCAPFISSGRCLAGLSCNLTPLNFAAGFWTCEGQLQFQQGGGLFQ